MTSSTNRTWKVIVPILLVGVLLATCVLKLVGHNRDRGRAKRTMPVLEQWMIEACVVALANDERLCRIYCSDAQSCSFKQVPSMVSDNSYSADTSNWKPPAANEKSEDFFVCPVILECTFPGDGSPNKNQFIINVAMRYVDDRWEPALEAPNGQVH